MSALWPSNSRGEIEEKKQLYFDAGAKEFWLCGEDGTMTFSTRDAPLPPPSSARNSRRRSIDPWV